MGPAGVGSRPACCGHRLQAPGRSIGPSGVRVARAAQLPCSRGPSLRTAGRARRARTTAGTQRHVKRAEPGRSWGLAAHREIRLPGGELAVRPRATRRCCAPPRALRRSHVSRGTTVERWCLTEPRDATQSRLAAEARRRNGYKLVLLSGLFHVKRAPDPCPSVRTLPGHRRRRFWPHHAVSEEEGTSPANPGTGVLRPTRSGGREGPRPLRVPRETCPGDRRVAQAVHPGRDPEVRLVHRQQVGRRGGLQEGQRGRRARESIVASVAYLLVPAGDRASVGRSPWWILRRGPVRGTSREPAGVASRSVGVRPWRRRADRDARTEPWVASAAIRACHASARGAGEPRGARLSE
jgi:hypothetical protein